MIFRRLGESSLSVSRVGLGTLTWGTLIDLRTADKLFGAFLNAGGNLIDTAAAYGAGDSERLIGRLVSRVGRDRVVLSSKAGVRLVSGLQEIDTSAAALLRDLEGSLKRLNTDYLDLWQLHVWGETALSESLAAMDSAITSGKVRAIGVSNFLGWQLAQAATWQSSVSGRTALACAQFEYSLLARRAELEVLPATEAFGLGGLAWGPLGRGVLNGQYLPGAERSRSSRAADPSFSWYPDPYLNPESERVVTAVSVAAKGLDLSTAQVAWIWVRDSPRISAALTGARTAEQLNELLAVEEISLPDEIISALNDISGGPR